MQAVEKEIRERRKNEEAFIFALDKLLEQLELEPEIYYYNKATKIPKAYWAKGVDYFLILDELKLTKETRNRIWIPYMDRHGERQVKSFRNAYGDLTEELG